MFDFLTQTSSRDEIIGSPVGSVYLEYSASGHRITEIGKVNSEHPGRTTAADARCHAMSL